MGKGVWARAHEHGHILFYIVFNEFIAQKGRNYHMQYVNRGGYEEGTYGRRGGYRTRLKGVIFTPVL